MHAYRRLLNTHNCPALAPPYEYADVGRRTFDRARCALADAERGLVNVAACEWAECGRLLHNELAYVQAEGGRVRVPAGELADLGRFLAGDDDGPYTPKAFSTVFA